MRTNKKYADYTAREDGVATMEQAQDEVRREIEVRRRLYDKWVAESRLSHSDAHDRLSRLLAALRFLITAEQGRELEMRSTDQVLGAEQGSTAQPSTIDTKTPF